MATLYQNIIMLRRAFFRAGERNEFLVQKFCTTPTSSSKKNDKLGKTDKPTISSEEREMKIKEAKTKLNSLLESMSKETHKPFSSESKLNLASPPTKAPRKNSIKTKIDPEMLVAVEKISETFTQEKDKLKAKLITKLEAVAEESEKSRLEPFKPNKKKTEELNSLLNTLKVDFKKPKKTAETKLAETKIETLYSVKPSEIFLNAKFQSEQETNHELVTWKRLYKRELDLSITHPPANGFEQMIMWTKQGKLWQFPINNEQGLEEEAQVGFHEHVFLDHHLEPWCPRRGPVRHFMDLVIIGLSKNPYLTIAQKKEHINWFREFFDSQKSILVETGSIPVDHSMTPPSLST